MQSYSDYLKLLNWQQTFSSRTQNHLQFINLQVGEYKWSCRSNDYNGWVLCDGRDLPVSTYPELYSVLGNAFGATASNMFKLPDVRSRVPGATGQGVGLTSRALGAQVGSETHTLTTSEIPGHTHTGTTNAAGGHTHTTNAVGGSVGLAVADGTNTATAADSSAGELNVWTTPRALTINNAADHTHTFTTGSTGLGGAHSNMQPTVFLGNVFIFSGVVTDVAPPSS